MVSPDTHSQAIEAVQEQAERTGRFIAGLSQPELDRPTPCKGWLVRDILAHLVTGGEGVRDTLRAVAASQPTPAYDLRDQGVLNQRGVDSCRNDADLPERFQRMLGDLKEVIADIEAKGLQRAPFRFFAEMTPEQLSALLTADVATHLWDLGQAVGRPQPPDPAILAKALPQMLVEVLPKTFLPDRARGLVCTYGIKLTDIPNGEWLADVNDGTISITRAPIAAAQVKTIADAGTFVLISYGRLSPLGQVLRGKVKSRGNPLLAMKFGTLFQKV